MKITMNRFGLVLTSRQSGKEAYSAFLPTLTLPNDIEDIVVDFSEISVMSPSWGDEFLTPLQKKFGNRVLLSHTSNPSVALTIAMLEKINGLEFRKT